MSDWKPISAASKDGAMLDLFCPGVSLPTKGVLQGCWNDRLAAWTLNPYGTTQFVTLFPSMYREIEGPPTQPADVSADAAVADVAVAVVDPAAPGPLIPPEAGRVMHLYFADIETAKSLGISLNDVARPCAASCAFVWSNYMVNVGLLDHQGTQCSLTSVQLLQGDDKPNMKYWLEWMPFQKGQAKAQDAAAQK